MLLRVLLVVASLHLAGCAGKPTQNHSSQEKIERIERVEIFYHAEDPGVMHVVGEQTGQAMIGLGGLLGPLGVIGGAVAYYAANQAALDQTETRSAAFKAAVQTDIDAADMHEKFARGLGAVLQKQGREVKLTKVGRLPGRLPGFIEDEVKTMTRVGGPTGSSGAGDLQAVHVPQPVSAPRLRSDLAVSPGHVPLLLRITTGYGARGVASSFRPIVVIDYALADPASGAPLATGHMRTLADATEHNAFLTFDKLMENARSARGQIEQSLMPHVSTVHKALFVFDR